LADPPAYGYSVRVLHERALENQKTRGISYNRSIQTAEIMALSGG
jgi:hypothetical protein